MAEEPFNYEKWRYGSKPQPAPVAQPQAAQPEQAIDFPSIGKLAPLAMQIKDDPVDDQVYNFSSTDEAFDYTLNNYGETAFERSPNGLFKIRDEVVKSDPFFAKGGSPKKLVPAGTTTSRVTTEEFKRTGQGPVNQRNFYIIDSAGEPGAYHMYNPDKYQDFMSDPGVIRVAKMIHSLDRNKVDFDQNSDHYIRQAVKVLRNKAIDDVYGPGAGAGSVSTAFITEPKIQQKKEIPDQLPFGVPGVPEFQFNMPGAPTAVGVLASGLTSGYDALIGNKVFDFGQAMMGQYDDKKLGDLVANAEAPLQQPRATGFLGGQEERRSRNPFAEGRSNESKAVNAIILSRYSPEQIASMPLEQKRKVGIDAAKEHLRNVAISNLKSAFELNQDKEQGISGFRTKEFYDENNQSISKLSQQTAGSVVPTAAPMLASMFGSIAAGPVGGKAASAATTYKLSTDAEFLGLVTKWAADNGIDIYQKPEVVVEAMVKMANEDPVGFSKKMQSMVQEARVAGGLEAGVAFALNEVLDNVKLPKKWSREGSILKIITKTGNPGVARRLLLPRAVKVLEETGKEAVEEYFTEVFVNIGKDTNQKIQQGTPAWQAAQESLRTSLASYEQEFGEADPNDPQFEQKRQEMMQRNDAAAVGAYMSLITRLLTGKGNPDTALIQQARAGAARAIAASGSKPITEDEIIQQLKTMEGATFEQLWEFADEQLMLAGHGTIDDYMERQMRPLTHEQVNQAFPDPLNPRLEGDVALSPGQQAAISPAPIVQAADKDVASAEAQKAFLEVMAKNRQAMDNSAQEEASSYNRNLDLEIEKAYSELLKATRYLRINPENQGAIDAVNAADRKYKELKAKSKR